MFESLSDRLSHSLRSITGKARLTEENIQETMREVRMALLEADVALPVVKEFVDSVRQRALGQDVMKSLSPGQAFLRIVQVELETVMGPKCGRSSVPGASDEKITQPIRGNSLTVCMVTGQYRAFVSTGRRLAIRLKLPQWPARTCASFSGGPSRSAMPRYSP